MIQITAIAIGGLLTLAQADIVKGRITPRSWR
jgi:hypothetical protein